VMVKGALMNANVNLSREFDEARNARAQARKEAQSQEKAKYELMMARLYEGTTKALESAKAATKPPAASRAQPQLAPAVPTPTPPREPSIKLKFDKLTEAPPKPQARTPRGLNTDKLVIPPKPQMRTPRGPVKVEMRPTELSEAPPKPQVRSPRGVSKVEQLRSEKLQAVKAQPKPKPSTKQRLRDVAPLVPPVRAAPKQRSSRNEVREDAFCVVFDFDQTLAVIEVEPPDLKKSLEHMFGGAKRLAVVHNMLTELTAKGVILAIVSFNQKRAIRQVLKRAEWLGLFEEGGIHGFDEVSEMGFRKDADKGDYIAKNVMAPLHLPACNVIFIDDNSKNVRDVANVGCETVWVGGGGGMKDADFASLQAWVQKHVQ